MRPAWRLAINTVSTRRSRSALLSATVALSAALIAAVACAMSSIEHAIERNIVETVGLADLRITPLSSSRPIPARVLEAVARWPEVKTAAGSLQASVTLEYSRPWWGEIPDPAGPSVSADREPSGLADTSRRARTLSASGVMLGVIPGDEHAVRPRTMVEGRWPERPGEVVLDEMLAGRLSRDASPGSLLSQVSRVGRGKGQRERVEPRVDPMPLMSDSQEHSERLNRAWELRPGDTVRWVRLLRRPVTLTVVGIVAQPPLGGRSNAYVLLDDLADQTGQPGVLSSIDVVLLPGHSADEFAAERSRELPPGVVMQTAASVTSNLRQNMAGNRVGYAVISTMAFLGASFIIMTGLLTAVSERQRELAMLRCIGASRGQVFEAQVALGAMIGVVGAVIGLPLGVAIAAAVVDHFKAEIPTGLRLSVALIAWAGIGAVGSGVVGAMLPAWLASRASPLEAMAVRSRPARPVHARCALVAGMVLVAVHLGTMAIPAPVEVAFWIYVIVGLPALIAGYFLLGVPVTWLVARSMGGMIARLARLPAGWVVESIRAAPLRYGFTAGAMSFGLAMMVGVWTQGNAVLKDWIDRLRFPEAFVVGLNIHPEAQARIDALPFVRRTCAITLHPIETDVFGVRGLSSYTSTFIAFEPEPFFEMTDLEWVEGDPATARARLAQGGGVLVAREFRSARGLGVGDRLVCRSDGREVSFEIVGVVHSPGLEIISQLFSIGQDYTQQSIHAVFGTRADLRDRLGSDAVQLIQIGLVPESDPRSIPDEAVVASLRRELAGAGIQDAGSARRAMSTIRDFVERTLMISSAVAVFALVISSLGVANIIAASIAARRFEFGVLRAVGAGRWLVARIVLSEVAVVAIAACLVGVFAGLQGAAGGRHLQKQIIGMDLRLEVPWGAVGIGCLFVAVVCVGASLPSILGLARSKPRDLLASVRG